MRSLRKILLGMTLLCGWLLQEDRALASPGALTFGGSAAGQVQSVCPVGDGSGDVYVAGVFTGQMTAGSTTLISGPSPLFFVSRMNYAGDVLWLKSVDTVGSTIVSSIEIASDLSGNAYIAGFFAGTLKFPGVTLSTGTNDRYYVAKMNSSGEWLWARGIQSATNNHITTGTFQLRVADDTRGLTGKIYVDMSGHFTRTITMGSLSLTPGAPSQNNSGDGFVIRIDGQGAWQWAQKMGALSNGSNFDTAARIVGIRNDAAGNVYAAGYMNVGATFPGAGQIGSLSPLVQTDYVFVGKILPNGQWSWVTPLGKPGSIPGTTLLHLARDSTDGSLYAVGTFGFSGFGYLQDPNVPYNTGKLGSAFFTKFSKDGVWQWNSISADSNLNNSPPLLFDMETDSNGSIYVTGGTWLKTTFSGDPNDPNNPARFVPPPLDISQGNEGEVYLAKATAGGSGLTWNWIRSGGQNHVRSGVDVPTDLILDEFGFLTVGGYMTRSTLNSTSPGWTTYPATFGPHTLQPIAPTSYGFVVKLDVAGNWVQGTTVVGQPIPPPSGAISAAPEFELLGGPAGVTGPTSYVWCQACPRPADPNSLGVAFLTAPVSGLFRWKTSTSQTDANRIEQLVVGQFPSTPQIHIAGAPVQLEPTQGSYHFGSMLYTSSTGATVTDGNFSATNPGYSVLAYTQGPTYNPATHPIAFTVVRTLPWNSEDCGLNPDCLTEASWPMGQKITDAAHSDPTGKNGYVLFQNSFYDGFGPEKAYDRATRRGTILPVNEDTEDPEDDLVVVWYKQNATTSVPWPVKPVRYEALWPERGELFQAGASGDPNSVLSIADDNVVGLTTDRVGRVYWTDQLNGRIRRANQNGTGVTTLATGLQNPGEITFANGRLYWTETGSGRIRSLDPNSPTTITDLATHLEAPFGIEVIPSGTYSGVYFTDLQRHEIRKIPLAGGAATTLLTGKGQPYGLGGVGGGTTNLLTWTDRSSNKVRKMGSIADPNTLTDLASSVSPGVMETQEISGTTFVLWGDGLGNLNVYDLAANTRTIRATVPGSGSLAIDRVSDPNNVSRDFSWATSDNQILIANQKGSDASGPPLNPEMFPSKMIYHQPDPSLPGYNPNDEHALFQPSNEGYPYDALFALRNDLNAASAAYTLLKYRDTRGTPAVTDDEWTMRVYSVGTGSFAYTGTAGQVIQAPYPLNLLPSCTTAPRASYSVGVPGFRDYKGTLWAKSDGTLDVHYFYPLQPSFAYDTDGDGIQDAQDGTCLPWLDRLGTIGTPIRSGYTLSWPSNAPVLAIGETLLEEKNGLPNIADRAAAKIIYDQSDPTEADPNTALAQLIDPLGERSVPYTVTTFPGDLGVEADGSRRIIVSGQSGALRLPFHLRTRLRYDPVAKTLIFRGYFDQTGDFLSGEPLLLPNVMSAADRTLLLSLSAAASWDTAIEALYNHTRNPYGLDIDGNGTPDTGLLIGLQRQSPFGAAVEPLKLVGTRGALTAGRKQKSGALTSGYVTLAFDDDPTLSPSPVSLSVIRIACGPYQGQLQLIKPDNVFDEQVTLRHSGDFGADPEALDFQWYYQPVNGAAPTVFPDPPNQLNGWTAMQGGTGVNSVTLGGPSVLTISDNWFVARYKGYPACGNDTSYSAWAGDPAGDPNNPAARLAEGWIKRVTSGLNPFDQAANDFHNPLSAAPNTFASMLQQLGGRYEGDISMSPNPANLAGIRLISAYETALRRALGLSVDAGLEFAPANDALLNISGRLADFYMLLGNEAYADAADPTIGYSTQSGVLGSLAPAVFAFQNQLDSLLEEELGLLRGRDQKGARPSYNKLLWNFTNGDGQVAYVQSYNLSDQNADGQLNVTDASILFPQGHGDAWGHYLRAMYYYYRLLKHPNFTWLPRAEFINVAGQAIPVDYQDERKFARAAAAKAKAGAEIVDLTYRLNYVEDPAGQWQGYKDTDTARAWGVTEWATRTGQAAYLDWAVANAILPAADPNNPLTGIQKVDRSTVLELAEIGSNFQEIQRKMDNADQGLNPVGIAKGSIPFDIDPSLLSGGPGIAGKSHFEQVYERAQTALNSAVKVFDNANELSQMLRRNQDTVEQFQNNVADQERDFRNRLIEIFGTPYLEDFQPSGTYPIGYDGADFYHYQYIDPTELTGSAAPVRSFQTYFTPINGEPGFFAPGSTTPFADPNLLEVTLTISTDGSGIVKPQGWTRRQSPGELQKLLSDFYVARANYERGVLEYDNLLAQVEAELGLLQLRQNLAREELEVLYDDLNHVRDFNNVMAAAQTAAGIMHGAAQITKGIADAAVEAFPRVVGVAYDATSPYRSGLKYIMLAATIGLEVGAGIEEGKADSARQNKEEFQLNTNITVRSKTLTLENAIHLVRLQELIRKEPGLRLQVFTLKEVVRQSLLAYHAKLAEGERLIQEIVILRQRTSAQVADYRYQDMAFRIFRNDALQKYRAAFDLAARYAYLAATAYDYETNLLGTSTQAGRRFLTDIVRFRSLGQVIGGEPVAGSRGLADPLARLKANYDVLKGQLGFNNPQIENNGFSLREEMLRFEPRAQSGSGLVVDTAWSSRLESFRVQDLNAVAAFKKYCRPFAPPSAGQLPGLVIPFSTTVTYGKNFFDWPLGGGDSAFDATHFATKIRSTGLAMIGYDDDALSATPRVYLVPAGLDVMRSPTGDTLATREFKVLDQAVPPPFPVGDTDLADPDWIPSQDSLPESLGSVRRYATFKAFPQDDLDFDPLDITSENRLVGRSVWNTRWLLIIPGSTLLADGDEGLDTLIHGRRIPGGNGERDGNGLEDLRLFFTTYAYTGN